MAPAQPPKTDPAPPADAAQAAGETSGGSEKLAGASSERTQDDGLLTRLTWSKTSTVGIGVIQGTACCGSGLQPTQDLRLSHKSVLSLGNWSLHLKARGNIDREFGSGGKGRDEPYASERTYIQNGSVIDRKDQMLIEEAYVEKLGDGWLAQLGSQPYAWGAADTLNPMSVFSQADLRRGFTAEKEQSNLATPSARFALLGDASTLNFVYAPWQQGALVPGPTQSWYVNTDNLAFTPALLADVKVRSQGSFAVKYDHTIPNGDVSLLAYDGADNDLTFVPASITTINNQPPVLNLQQVLTTKTTYGASVTQTLGAWVLKAEGSYSPNKKVLQDIELASIGTSDLTLPLPLVAAPTYQSTLGFNYFTPIHSFLGAPLGETVLTSEYYRQRYLKAHVLPPQISDLLITNLRTAAMEDRLELFATYLVDLKEQGSLAIAKALFHGETVKHSLSYAHVQGTPTAKNKLASVFYYWRNNDFLAYELAYAF